MYFTEGKCVVSVLDILKLVSDFPLGSGALGFIRWTVSFNILVSEITVHVDGRRKGARKMVDVDVDTKQRMVVEFLTAEGVRPEEIQARLQHVFGADTVDLDSVRNWAHRPGESDMTFEGRVVYRTVIQFLTAEGDKPREIAGRLQTVYRSVAYSEVSVWRWAVRFLAGDNAVGDRFRHGRPPSCKTTEPPLTVPGDKFVNNLHLVHS